MGGRPFLVVCDRVLFSSTFLATDDNFDEDYSPTAELQSSKKKSRSSQKLSTSSVRSSKRVRLASLLPGSVSKPRSPVDSSGEEIDPPTNSASKTLESRYTCIFLVAVSVLWLRVAWGLISVLLIIYIYIMFYSRWTRFWAWIGVFWWQRRFCM